MKLSKSQPLILASASPRRRELLSLAGIPFRAVVSNVSERQHANEKAVTFTIRTARLKAAAVASRQPPGRWVLGADTSVVVDREVLGKPKNAADATRMLQLLSGRSHCVLTAVSLLQAGQDQHFSLVCKTNVEFRELNPQIIAGYVATGEPLDKAGAYGIQGRGSFLVASISGSYTNVVGLPLCETVLLLEQAGIFCPFVAKSTPQAGGLL
jgi:septum formation protein